MSRRMIVGAAQMGPVECHHTAEEVAARMTCLLEQAAQRGVELLVFPELASVPFFPHWVIGDREELLSYYDLDTPFARVRSFFDRAAELDIAVVMGYAEQTTEGRLFNSSVLADGSGKVALKYRKIHLPGFGEPQSAEHQLLEKRYFEVGDLGFPVAGWKNTRVGLAICNDRRWAETYRVMALQRAEIVCLGYNTPVTTPHLPEINTLTEFHNHLSMQAGAYQNSLWVIGVGKAGLEEGVEQIGGSAIIAPSGEIVAQATSRGDELITADIDLDMVKRYRQDVFNFAHHRRPEAYQTISAPVDPHWSDDVQRVGRTLATEPSNA